MDVPGAIVRAIHQEAAAAYPREACGFLFGRKEGSTLVVSRAAAAQNRAARLDRFLIEAREVFEAMRSARREGVELVGIYHSHPDAPPEPSPTDQADTWLEGVYLIVSCRQDGSTAQACWLWSGDDFADVPLHVTEDAGETVS